MPNHVRTRVGIKYDTGGFLHGSVQHVHNDVYLGIFVADRQFNVEIFCMWDS